jgi:hypothetical protein
MKGYFTVIETVVYSLEAEGRTLKEAAKNAGIKFGRAPQSFTPCVEDHYVCGSRDEYELDSTDVTEQFDAGMEIENDKKEMEAMKGEA